MPDDKDARIVPGHMGWAPDYKSETPPIAGASLSVQRRVAEQVREEVERKTADAIADWLVRTAGQKFLGVSLLEVAARIRRGDWRK